MSNSKTAAFFGTVLSVALVITPPMAAAQDGAATEKQRMMEKGLQHETAWALYHALKEDADGGQRLTWKTIPDWSGVYTRSRGGFFFDPDQPEDGVATAKLTPEYHAKMMKRIAQIERGIEFDSISTHDVSPGLPRWLDLPFSSRPCGHAGSNVDDRRGLQQCA